MAHPRSIVASSAACSLATSALCRTFTLGAVVLKLRLPRLARGFRPPSIGGGRDSNLYLAVQNEAERGEYVLELVPHLAMSTTCAMDVSGTPRLRNHWIARVDAVSADSPSDTLPSLLRAVHEQPTSCAFMDMVLCCSSRLESASDDLKFVRSQMLLPVLNGLLINETASSLHPEPLHQLLSIIHQAMQKRLCIISIVDSLASCKATKTSTQWLRVLPTQNGSQYLKTANRFCSCALQSIAQAMATVLIAGGLISVAYLKPPPSKNGPQQSKTAIILGFRSLQALLFIHGWRRTLRHGHHSLELLQRLHFKFLGAHSHAALRSKASSAPFGMLALMLVLLLLWFAAVVSQSHNKSFIAYFVNMLKMIGTSSFKNMHGALIFGLCYASRRVSMFPWSCCFMTFLIFSHKVKVKDPTLLPHLRP